MKFDEYINIIELITERQSKIYKKYYGFWTIYVFENLKDELTKEQKSLEKEIKELYNPT